MNFIMNIIVLLKLLCVHFIVDFVFQQKKQIKEKMNKQWKSFWLYIHGMLSGIVSYVFIGIWDIIWIILVIGISHVLIDGIKTKTKDTLFFFIIDQLCHLFVIFLCWIVLNNYDFSCIFLFFNDVFANGKFWIFLLIYSIVIWPAGIFINKVMSPWQKKIYSCDVRRNVYKIGIWIGRLERILIVSFILLDNFGAIGFLITAKSILRFESKENNKEVREHLEYVLLGTMFSMVIAVICGIVGKKLLNLC